MRRHLPALALLVLLTGCGGGAVTGAPTAGGPTDAPTAAGAPDAPAAGGAAPGAGDCGLDAAALDAATARTWELATTLTGEPHPTLPSVTLDVTCLFTADEVDEFGDPLALRVDVAGGEAAPQVQEGFRSSCTDNGGQTAPADGVADAEVCLRDGQVQEGAVVRDGRVVEVYYPSVDRALAEDVTSSFGRVLEAVR